MREILFRGKRCDNGEWVYGDLLHPDIYGNGYSIEDFTQSKNNCCDVEPKTVGQYTGLKDKNGKRIFEGDVVEYETHYGHFKGVVAIVDGNAVVVERGASMFLHNSVFRYKAVCVGNAHDNPELLEV